MPIKRSSIQLIVAMCLVISLVGAMLPLQSTIALQSGTRNAPIQLIVNGSATGTCPCSIWDTAAVPAQPAATKGRPIEVGVKFRSEASGYVTGLRFYRGAANRGVHVGHLWASNGALLASATFVNESGSGWQTVNLASPVLINAGTTYIASYYSSSGYFAFSPNYFTSGVDNGPLHAMAAGVEGPNGVYAFGSSAFPTSGSTHNYWVDVVFSPVVASDTGVPPAPSVSQEQSVPGISASTNITATFGEGRVPPASSSTPAPAGPLSPSATDTATVTAAAPLLSSADEGPGGPILVVASASNPFGRYYAEILHTEGFNAYTVTDISSVSAAMLSNYDVVILGEMSLTSAQVTTLTNWVTAGGNLIAMRPDKQLAGLLGLLDAGTTLTNAYLLINTATPPGAGLVNQTIQFHGTADRYTLNGATAAATLYSSASTATANPAVTLKTVGTGHAAAFTYDLARSVVYTRQGNPAWAGHERDGNPPIRSDDMFYPNWVDLNKVAIPQADEQQRLLANLIEQMNLSRKPLPRFWYFPRGEKAVVIMTGDDHADGGTAGRFDHLPRRQSGRLLGCELGMCPQYLVHVPQYSHHTGRGPVVHGPRL